jgi:rod shape-determining protein MreC
VQDPIASVIRGTVLAPLLALQRQAQLIKNARVRYTALAAQRDSALMAAQGIDAIREENERLREILALTRRIRGQHISAEVLHQAVPTDGYTLVLSVGSEEGVQPMKPVVAAGGLLGVVRSVEAHTAVAAVWSHPEFRVSAMALDGSVFGIVAPRGSGGPNEMLLELRGVPYREQVPAGTQIYTSGLGGSGGLYPRGIPIGQVLGIAEEREGWSRTYLVRPSVHPAAVSHVIVLTERPLDLGDAFEEGR